MNLKKLFLNHCKVKKLEINTNQLTTVKAINEFYHEN